MRIGRIKNRVTGDIIDVTATTSHPDSHYGIPVWVDKNNTAYIEADSKIDNPYYEVVLDSNIERMRVGLKIAELRAQKGLSVRQLAELSGVSYANICKLERGHYNASIDILSKICNALGARIDIV